MIQRYEFFAGWLRNKFSVDLAELTAERQESQGLVEYALIIC